MNKVHWLFVMGGLVAFGIAIGLVIPRPVAPPETARTRAAQVRPQPSLFPTSKQEPGIVGKWENLTKNEYVQPVDQGYYEFFPDGTLIESHTEGNSQYETINKWKPLDEGRMIIEDFRGNQDLKTYTILNDRLTIESNNYGKTEFRRVR